MKDTLIRYAIVASMGAFVASLSSCGTTHSLCAAYASIDHVESGKACNANHNQRQR